MAYLHGIRIQENPTSVPTPVVNETGIPVVFGTAPVNLVKDPAGAVNVPKLCNNFAEAQAAFGYSEDYESYTLCQAMDAFFKIYGVGPVVFVNVLDPDKADHKEAYTDSSISVSGGQVTGTQLGVLLKDLNVKDATSEEADMTIDTDYTVSFNDEGYVVVTVLKEHVTSVSLSGNKLKPSGVKAADIIGTYDAESGKETGLELVREVYPLFQKVPSLLLAPGWSKDTKVGLALGEKCYDISGMFRCECLIDIDTSTVKKYTDVAKAKKDAGYFRESMICLWPMVKCSGKAMAYSALYAAMVSYTDYNNDNVPNLSPSNKALRASATILSDGTDVTLDILQANELNGAGIVTALNLNGYKAWGNNTAAYPDTTDPKDRWIACRRFFSWWGNSFITTYLSKVDDPANYRLIESIVDSENVRANSLVSMGKCAGLRMVYSKEDNPIGNVLDGKIRFRQYLAPYTPAEDILNVLEFDPSMIETALGGE